MDETDEHEVSACFAKLTKYREQVNAATDAQTRARLLSLIRETEDRLAQLRASAYQAFIRGD